MCYWDNGMVGYSYFNGFDYELMSFLFIVGIFAVIIGLYTFHKKGRLFFANRSANHEALEFVKLRYARGEINLQEYEKITNALKD